MSRYSLGLGAGWLLVLAVVAGCQPQQPFYFREDGDLSHYKDMALNIEYPDVNVPTLGDAEGAIRPLSVSNSEPKEIVEITLEEAVRTALLNSKVVRLLGGNAVALSGGSGPSSPDYLLRSPTSAATIYDPAIIESDPRSGVEAALAAFDAQFKTAFSWATDNEPLNSASRDSNNSDLGEFSMELTKINAAGGRMSIKHSVDYFQDLVQFQNQTTRLPHSYGTTFQLGVRQPLLRGAGVGFNRIAGPLATVPGALDGSSLSQGGSVPGVNNGVLIARLNADVGLANFEANARNLVYDVENAYWELYFTYRNLDAVVSGRNSALMTWRKIYALYEVGAKGGEAEKEAQAREQYFLFRSTLERALSSLYKAEANLRYMMGIAATDGRLFRPADEPTSAMVTFDWHAVCCESLVRSVELRQQRWQVKRRELEMVAAKNYLLPQLDFLASYRFSGLGEELLDSSNTNVGPWDYSYNSLFHGKYQDYTVGLQLNMPLGFRREMAGVRNAQLQLARERAVLQEQELELSHQMAFALRDLDANHVVSQTNFNRRIAAERQVEAVRAAYETDTVTLDVLLNAQRQLAQAESDFYRSVVDYNKSIATIHYRKGSLLEYNGVYLAEGPWPAKAYFDACRLARSRDAATYMDYGLTLPRVMSRGEYQQHMGELQGSPWEGGMPTLAEPEVIPAPTPATPAPPVPQKSSGDAAGIAPAAGSQVQTASSGGSAQRPEGGAGKKYDLGAMNLAALGGKQTGSAAGKQAPGGQSVLASGQRESAAESNLVRATSYEQTASSPAKPGAAVRPGEGGARWASNTGRTFAQPVANSTSPEVDRTASGWTRAQR